MDHADLSWFVVARTNQSINHFEVVCADGSLVLLLLLLLKHVIHLLHSLSLMFRFACIPASGYSILRFVSEFLSLSACVDGVDRNASSCSLPSL